MNEGIALLILVVAVIGTGVWLAVYRDLIWPESAPPAPRTRAKPVPRTRAPAAPRRVVHTTHTTKTAQQDAADRQTDRQTATQTGAQTDGQTTPTGRLTEAQRARIAVALIRDGAGRDEVRTLLRACGAGLDSTKFAAYRAQAQRQPDALAQPPNSSTLN